MNLEYPSLTEVPEGLREHFIEHGGKAIHKDVVGLLGNRDAALNEKKQLAERLKGFEGVDPKKYQELIAAQDEAQRKQAEAAGDWKARETQILDKHQVDIKRREERERALLGAIEKHAIREAATRAISNAKGVTELLLPHIVKNLKVVEENGEFTARVVDDQGNVRIGDVKGSPMTIDQLVDELKNDKIFARCFEATGAGGSGAPVVQGGQSGNGVVALKRAEAKDPARYRAVREQAAKTGARIQIVD